MKRTAGLTIVEVLVLLGVIVVIVLISLPMLRMSRRTARCAQSNTPLQSIHAGMVLYAAGNNGWYPGLDAQGRLVKPAVEDRYRIMMDNNYFMGEYMISSVESKTIWTTGAITTANYSYAMLQLSGEAVTSEAGGTTLPAKSWHEAAGRIVEWQATTNAMAPVLTDRNTGSDADGRIQSVHVKEPGQWRGAVVWNDHHVKFETRHLLNTRFGRREFPGDHLFKAAGADDAWMVYSGNGEGAEAQVGWHARF